ncbi:MAG: SDH family Clp fold serine proteinase [Gemmatimonadaceae bacterium]
MTYTERKTILQEWERARASTAILYVTGDRPGLETQIHPEVLDFFSQHLDGIGTVKTISLFLHTRGGSTLAAWSLVNLLRQFTERLEIIVPSKAHSAGTLMCLGADSIMMTRQATLGPIDPSVNGPLNPEIPGAPPQQRAPVSVEAINGFLAFAKNEIGFSTEEAKLGVLRALSERVHPLVLGEVYRSRSQIRMLGRRLIKRQLTDETRVDKVLDFLCSESGSHDYTIYRQEARDELGLKVERPTDALYALIRDLHRNYAAEMKFGTPLSPESALAGNAQAPYSHVRAAVESVAGGSHRFVSEGTYTRQQVQVVPGVMQPAVADSRTFEGWKHTT